MGCGGNSSGKTVNLDFEDKEPNGEKESEVFSQVKPLLDRTGEILEQLKSYTGCAEYIKLAVRTPSTENDISAWNAVVPAVNMLKDFFEYYSAFKDGLIQLLEYACKDNDPHEVLQESLGVTRIIVEMLDFIIRYIFNSNFGENTKYGPQINLAFQQKKQNFHIIKKRIILYPSAL